MSDKEKTRKARLLDTAMFVIGLNIWGILIGTTIWACLAMDVPLILMTGLAWAILVYMTRVI